MDVILIVLIGALLIAGVIIWSRRSDTSGNYQRSEKGKAFKKTAESSTEPISEKESPEPTSNNDLSGLVVGGRIKITDHSILSGEYKIIKRHLIYSNGVEWVEYECRKGKSEFSIEFVEEEAFVSYQELTFEQVGLDEFDPMTVPSELYFDGSTFTLDNQGSGSFYENGDKRTTEFYDFFEYKNGSEFITIEDWGNGEIEIYLALEVNKSHFSA